MTLNERLRHVGTGFVIATLFWALVLLTLDQLLASQGYVFTKRTHPRRTEAK